MIRPVLAILTESIRFDNHHPLKYFKRLRPVHFYKDAPYGDLKKEELKNAVQYKDWQDLEEKLLKLKPDIIQGAEPYGSRKQLRLCYLAWKISRQLKIPLIFGMLENRNPRKRFGLVLGIALKRILRAYAKRAKLIFYLNGGARTNLIMAGVPEYKLKRLLYGVWGVDTNIFKPFIPLLERGGKGRKRILFVGRIDEAKGIPYLLEALEMVRKDYPKIEMVMAGKGVMEDRVKSIRGVKLVGMVKNQDLPALYNSALFTVYPSVTLQRWEEQVGTVNLQSLACGTPVITTTSGAIPEYVNDKVGILVPERDSEALYQAMKKLLTDEKYRSQLAKNARPYIVDNFDARKTVQKTEEILLGLLR